MFFLTQFQLEEARLTKRDTYLDAEADPRKKRSPIDLDSAVPAEPFLTKREAGLSQPKRIHQSSSTTLTTYSKLLSHWTTNVMNHNDKKKNIAI